MKTVELKIKVEKPFGNLFRRECVLLAVFDHENKLLMGEKPQFYPPMITRLLGGGVGDGEASKSAAVRELAEELNVKVVESELRKRAVFTIHAIDADGNSYNNSTYLYSVYIGAQEYKAGDDVKFISKFNQDDLRILVKSYASLSKTLWYKGAEGEFSWYDYAQVYGPIHKEVLLNWTEV